MVRSKGLVAALVLSCVLATSAHAVGPTAGTSVSNRAQVSYTLGGVAETSISSPATSLVAEILDLNVTLQSSTVTVSAGDISRTLHFWLPNTGNGVEALALDNLVAGDDFGPLTASTAIFSAPMRAARFLRQM